MEANSSITTIDQYIDACPNKEAQEILKKVRQKIHESAPEAKEKVSYGIPTFTLNGKNFIHFGGYEKHIGLYPGSIGVTNFENDLKDYDTSKGTIRFPLDKPIPYDLIAKISKYCAQNASSSN